MSAVILARPSRPVEVLHDGRWVPGWVEAYRRDGDGWRACVRYSAGVGMHTTSGVVRQRCGADPPNARRT